MALYIGNLYLQNFQEFSRIDANIMRVSLILCFFAATKAKPRSCLEVVRCVEFTSSGFFFFFFFFGFFFFFFSSVFFFSPLFFINSWLKLHRANLQPWPSLSSVRIMCLAKKSRHGNKVSPRRKSLAMAEKFGHGGIFFCRVGLLTFYSAFLGYLLRGCR